MSEFDQIVPLETCPVPTFCHASSFEQVFCSSLFACGLFDLSVPAQNFSGSLMDVWYYIIHRKQNLPRLSLLIFHWLEKSPQSLLKLIHRAKASCKGPVSQISVPSPNLLDHAQLRSVLFVFCDLLMQLPQCLQYSSFYKSIFYGIGIVLGAKRRLKACQDIIAQQRTLWHIMNLLITVPRTWLVSRRMTRFEASNVLYCGAESVFRWANEKSCHPVSSQASSPRVSLGRLKFSPRLF